MTVSVKICGLNNPQSVQAVIDAKADYAGFVYYPASPRHITLSQAATLKALLPANIQSVSVLVDPDDGLLNEVADVVRPSFMQLHGKESSERVKAIRERFTAIKIIKAISIRTKEDIQAANEYMDCADMLMFDAKAPDGAKLPGGNGSSFDWNLLKERHFALPWMLSGGLTTENVAQAVKQTGALIVDVSSGVEQKAGVKDAALIEAFTKAAKNH